MSEWQQIETAPKDGTVILGFWTPYAPMEKGREHTQYSLVRYSCGVWVNPDDDQDDYADPTHWMPLPAPPKAD